MTPTPRLPLTRARALAEALAADLAGGCERLQIAGPATGNGATL